MKDFGGLENGFIVLSTTDVVIGGTLNPDAAGNQKFAVNALIVNGTVDATTTGTYRAYLVDGTEVKQRCGRVVIEEPIPVPRLTTLSVAGTTIVAQGSSKQIDENSALAGTIANRAQLSSGFVVLSASNVSVGGTLNPDASGNQKFAISADTISGTVDATNVGTLHAYLVDGTSVLQKCGDVVIVAPHAEVTAFVGDGTNLLAPASSKSLSSDSLSGTYDAAHMNLLTNPRIVLSSNTSGAVGGQVTGVNGFNAANGSSQAYNLQNIANGSYRLYLIDATTAGGNTGTVVQVLGAVSRTDEGFNNVQLNSSDWDSNKSSVDRTSGTVTGVCTKAGFTSVALDKQNSKPHVGSAVNNTSGRTTASKDNPFSINYSGLSADSTYWLVAIHVDDDENDIVDAVWDFSMHTDGGV